MAATQTLPVRALGRKGPEITVTGFGAWAIGGGDWSFSWGPQDDNASIRAMRHAVEHGVNWIDTAAVYGLGHSEELVGRLIRELPRGQRPHLFTKCALVWDPKDRNAPPRRLLTSASLRKECEDSLRRLGVERIDLYQIHWPPEEGAPIEESWTEMGRLIEEGKVRWAGVSNFPVELMERCQRIRPIDSAQPRFSAIHRENAADVIPWCAKNGVGVIVYSPMQSGLLTDAWSVERVNTLPPDDWRGKSPDFRLPVLTANLAVRDTMRRIAERRGSTTSAVAVAWVLAWPGVTGAIVGARSPEQVDGWLAGATLKLTSQELDEIAETITKMKVGEGPSRPPK